MNQTVSELKIALETAEREHRHSLLRQQWLERRLLEAPTESEFHSLLAELTAQEENTVRLGQAVTLARCRWAGASIEARNTGDPARV